MNRRDPGRVRSSTRSVRSICPPGLPIHDLAVSQMIPHSPRRKLRRYLLWADTNAPRGDPHDALPTQPWVEGWNIPKQPDLVIQMPKPVVIPAHGEIEYTYEIVPTGLTEDKWVQISELRPSESPACPSRRGLYSSAGIPLVATCSRRPAIHSLQSG